MAAQRVAGVQARILFSNGAPGRNKQAYSEYVRNVVQRSRKNATAKYALSRQYAPPCLIQMALCYGWPESASSSSRYFIFRWRCWKKQAYSKYVRHVV